MDSKFTGICILIGSLIIASSIWYSGGQDSSQTERVVTSEVNENGSTEKVEHDYYYFNPTGSIARFDFAQETLEHWNSVYSAWELMNWTDEKLDEYIQRNMDSAKSTGREFIPPRTIDGRFDEYKIEKVSE